MFNETERLTITKLSTDEVSFFFELVNDPDWKKFIGDRNINTLQDAKDYLKERMLPNYSSKGFGFYKVSLKCDGTTIGISGLVDREGLEHIDVGFAFLPNGRGKGYAYESTKAVLEYAKDVLKLDQIVAISNSDNHKSHKLLKRLGLRFEKMIVLPNESEEICLFST